jgi:quercetin dioxygenase-like cupin family protein
MISMPLYRSCTIALLFLGVHSGSASRAQVILPDQGDIRMPTNNRSMIIKVDPQTVGSTQFMVGMEIVPPGAYFPTHKHPDQEEIVFVHKGTLTVSLRNAAPKQAVAGSIVFIPKDTWVAVENKSADPATFIFAFPRVGIEKFLRAARPRAGESPPITDEQRATIRKQFEKEIVIHPQAR